MVDCVGVSARKGIEAWGVITQHDSLQMRASRFCFLTAVHQNHPRERSRDTEPGKMALTTEATASLIFGVLMAVLALITIYQAAVNSAHAHRGRAPPPLLVDVTDA